MWIKGQGLFVCLLATLLYACGTTPLGRSQLTLLPEDQVAEMGAEAFNSIKKQTPASQDPEVNAYVQCVADAITQTVAGVKGAPEQWEVEVFRDDAVNAFALPGGRIGVYTGLLKVAETPSQLATVLGHEVAHVIADHGNERISQQFAVSQGLALVEALAGQPTATQQTLMGLLGVGAQVGVLLPYSRVQETEADKLGLDYMARAGFDPRQSVDLWQNMAKASGEQPPEFLSTHPSHESRINDLQARMAEALQRYQEAQRQGKNPQCKRP
ncbi:MAG: M48 family metallopeptidase [Gammaproteobacteria bacterium]|jgi:predicted Zn-dependent protease